MIVIRGAIPAPAHPRRHTTAAPLTGQVGATVVRLPQLRPGGDNGSEAIQRLVEADRDRGRAFAVAALTMGAANGGSAKLKDLGHGVEADKIKVGIAIVDYDVVEHVDFPRARRPGGDCAGLRRLHQRQRWCRRPDDRAVHQDLSADPGHEP